LEAGSASKLSKGDYVVASSSGVGTWSTHCISPADAWTKIQGSDMPGSSTFPVETAAVSVVAPLLAKHLLSVVPLSAGNVIVQNNASSTVGQAVIQYANQKNIKTINITRPHTEWGNLVYHLQGIGATLVVDEAYANTPAFGKLLSDLPKPSLGLNSAGGASFTKVANALGENGTLVTYGSMSRTPTTVPTSLFVNKNLTLKGANIAKLLKGMKKVDVDKAVNEVIDDLRGSEKDAKVKLLLAREPFLDFPIALERSYAKNERKVVLVMPA
jgi:mitochondrial enoyl-[acyl-carrier protein] reductase / trans-2-enoyl-CoA reductase